MAEKFEGKILNDADMSLPKIEDYYRNSLTSTVDLSKTTANSFFYIETPPDGEDHVGPNAAGTIFTIKAQGAFLINDYELLLHKIDGDTISVDISKCDVGDNETNKQYLKDITTKEGYKQYIETGPKYTTESIDNALTLRLLFMNCGEIPHFSIERLRKSAIKTINYGDITKYNTGYTYCFAKPELAYNAKKFTSVSYEEYKDTDQISYFDNNDLSLGSDDKNPQYHKHQVWFLDEDSFGDSDYGYYYVLNTDSSKRETLEGSLKARDKLYQTIQKATDARICVSTNVLKSNSLTYPQPYNIRYTKPTAFQNILKEIYSDLNKFLSDNWYYYSGYNLYGQELYKRILSVVYLKVDLDGKGEQWINLNKYIIHEIYDSNSNINAVEVNNAVHDGSPLEEATFNYESQDFKPLTYDFANSNYIDNFWTQAQTRFGQDQRRKEIQLKAFKQAGYLVDEQHLYDWTVSIGDVSFFVPPTSIRMITQTATERLPLLRAKGSMVKNIEKSDSQLEISLYFNRAAGINGCPVEMELWQKMDYNEKSGEVTKNPSKQTTTYDMNGLRALISEFKFTPFLPIVNKYINETLNVFAVSMENLEISTVPNFPRLIKATLKLKKFDYGVYMPELPDPFYTEEYGDQVVNPYALCINYDVMRYYYQKPLKLGNELAAKLNNSANGYNFNSIEFMKDTMFNNRTALMPCQFVDPNIDIYIANEDHLKRLLSIKQDEIRRMKKGQTSPFVPNDIQNDLINDIATLYTNKDKPELTLDRIYSKYAARRNEVVEAVRTAFGDSHTFDLDLTQYGLKHYNFVVQHLSEHSREMTEIRNKYIVEPMIADLKTAFKDNSKVINVYQNTSVICIEFNPTYVLDHTDIEDLIEQSFVGLKEEDDYDEDKTFKDNTLRFYLGAWEFLIDPMAPTSNDQYIISGMNKAEPDKVFADYCYEASTSLLDANKEASELKESMDWENVRSLKFDLIGENIRVDQFAASLANNFSRISTLDSDGKAPQYMGSQDIHISWSITTKDENFAGLMRGLPEYEAYCMRNYHLVLPSFPIRIDSEFTRMLGVYEVSIEDVVVSTVPNFPDLYHIQIRAISTDRTLRNREALRSLNNQQQTSETGNNTTTENPDTTNANGQSGILNNDGLTISNMQTQVRIRTYDELGDKLAEAELYPDLELPKIGELHELGFAFIRYKDKERDAVDLFVDPDFYFYYPYMARAELIRSVIKNQYLSDTSENLEREKERLKYSDLTGAQIEVGADGKLDYSTANDNFDKQIKEKQALKKQFDEAMKEQKSMDLAKIIPAAVMGDPGRWNISSKITTSFMEKYYLGLCEELKDKEISNDDEEAHRRRLQTLKDFYDNKMTGCIKGVSELADKLETTKNTYQDILFEDDVDEVIGNEVDKFKDLLKSLYIDIYFDGDVLSTRDSINNLFLAAWAANTSNYEYNSTLNDDKWKGRKDYYGTIYSQYSDEELAKESPDKTKIKRAGIFNIRRLTKDQLIQYLDSNEVIEFNKFYEENCKDPSKSYSFVLDPYYRFHPEEVDDYLYKCATDKGFCTVSFFRITLWWLLKLYKAQVYPSISLDVMRNEAINSATATDKAAELLKKYDSSLTTDISIDRELINSIRQFAQDNGAALNLGKMFTAVVLALYDQPIDSGKNEYYNYIVERNYAALNNKITTITSNHYRYRNNVNNPDAKIRKFLMALVGYDEVNAAEYLGRRLEASPGGDYLTARNTKIALEAASNPAKYMFHSFYDMLRVDYRGRMLRAFPTFYCIFLDEGKEVGLWKLHDNFYSINAIHELTITKSRKMPADVCTLILSNNYSTFTTDDEDGFINYKGVGFGELWDSLWHNKSDAMRQEKARLAANKVNRAKLQPGIRIHVRQGYGSDARELGGIFNGVITEVNPAAKAISIIAQGNGIELMQPILEDRDADEIQFQDNARDLMIGTSGGGASPRKILASFLTTKGSAINKYVQGHYNKDQWFFDIDDEPDPDSALEAWDIFMKEQYDDNPFGIRMFGDVDYKDIFPEGEVVQNLYEVSEFPFMDQGGLNLYADKEHLGEIPYISFDSRGKTIWDIIHICQSVAPDYITSTAPFGFRDTIFFGKPHYYYAYDYIKYNDSWIEKRKPFQQFHIYYSDTDIIANDIKASEQLIKTVATGLYQDKYGWYTRNADVGPMWVDKDIYPEKQKSMLVDTRLKMKDGAPWKASQSSVSRDDENNSSFLGDFLGGTLLNTGQAILNLTGGTVMAVLGPLFEEYLWPVIDSISPFDIQHNKKIAWAATANALKESVKEMYQGGIIVIGDPSIKPYDRIFLSDVNNNMQGQVLVRDVTHTLSAVTGFTTTINVDAISTVDDRDEMFKQTAFAKAFGYASTTALLAMPAYKVYKTGDKWINKGLEKVNSVLGSDEAKEVADKFKDKSFFKILSEAKDAIGELKDTYKTLGAIGTIGKAIGTGLKFVVSKCVPGMIVTALTGGIVDKIYWAVKNHQVLTVFPLKKNGMPYTAGLDGSMGLVYGSPTYNTPGPLEQVFAEYFTVNDKNSDAYNTIVSIFGNEDIMNEAARYNRDYKYFNGSEDNPVGQEANMESLYLGLKDRPEIHRPTSLVGLSLFPRVYQKGNEQQRKVLSTALERSCARTVDDVIKNTEKKEWQLLSADQRLQPYLTGDSKLLEIVHDNLSSSTNFDYSTFIIQLGSKQVEVNGIKYKESNSNKEVVDLPFLVNDSIIVLMEICKRVKNKISLNNSKENVQTAQDKNGTKIVLMSALTVNSARKHAASGYSFSLQGTGLLDDGKLKDIIKDLYKEEKDRLNKDTKEGETQKEPPFQVVEFENRKEVRIIVHPVSTLEV